MLTKGRIRAFQEAVASSPVVSLEPGHCWGAFSEFWGENTYSVDALRAEGKCTLIPGGLRCVPGVCRGLGLAVNCMGYNGEMLLLGIDLAITSVNIKHIVSKSESTEEPSRGELSPVTRPL